MPLPCCAMPPGKGKTIADRAIVVGDTVRLKGLRSQGTVEQIAGKTATVLVGDMRTKVPVSRLELITQEQKTADAEPKSKMDVIKEGLQAYHVSQVTQTTIDDHRKDFHPDLDVRGMRGDEALQAVRYFIDDAVLMGVQAGPYPAWKRQRHPTAAHPAVSLRRAHREPLSRRRCALRRSRNNRG